MADRSRPHVLRSTHPGLRHSPPTGRKSTKEIIRCLKRFIAREIFQLLTNPTQVCNGAELRTARLNARLSLAAVAEALSTWPIRISEIERGVVHNANLAHRYQLWLTHRHAA